jgi:hypothetical protein
MEAARGWPLALLLLCPIPDGFLPPELVATESLEALIAPGFYNDDEGTV